MLLQHVQHFQIPVILSRRRRVLDAFSLYSNPPIIETHARRSRRPLAPPSELMVMLTCNHERATTGYTAVLGRLLSPV